MSAGEGVIRFRAQLRSERPERDELLARLEAWRQVARRLGALGRDPARYGGLAFGNLSARDGDAARFLITASQTADAERLGPDGVVLVDGWDIDANTVTGAGVQPPSSETLTHAAVFDASPAARWAIHGHMPEIWRHRERLGLPSTPDDAANGTPELARAIQASVHRCGESALIALGGHEDGVLAYAPAPQTAFGLLVDALARALAVDHAT